MIDYMNRTSMHFAAANGSVEAVKILLEHDCDLTIEDSSGLTPHAVAINNGFTEVAELLK